jgi:hypothetical protein
MNAKRAATVALFACLVFVGSAGIARAEPLVDFDGGFVLYNDSSETIGYSFKVSGSGISVGGLGVFSSFSLPLQAPIDVGLWNASGDELASTTVTPGDTAVASIDANGQWLEAVFTPMLLTAGKYYVGAFYPSSSELVLVFPAIDSIAGVTYVDAQMGGSSGLTFPGEDEPSPRGELAGPTVFTADTTPIPEPITLSLFGAGLAGAAVLRRRKKAPKA